MPRRKQYQIINATTTQVRELDVDGRKVKINKRGEGWVYDKGLADEVNARYGPKARTRDGGKVLVAEVDDSDPQREQGHTYTFSVPDLSRFKGYQHKAKRSAASK